MSNSVTKKLAYNLSNYDPYSGRNKTRRNRKFSLNTTNLRKNLLKKKATKLRTRYNNNNTQLLHKYPKLKEIYFSHGVGKDKQFQKYKAADYARRRKERENALQTIDEPVIHRFIGGFEIPGEPTSKVKRARKRYINIYKS